MIIPSVASLLKCVLMSLDVKLDRRSGVGGGIRNPFGGVLNVVFKINKLLLFFLVLFSREKREREMKERERREREKNEREKRERDER